jgi:hypothetical protein
MARRMTRSVTKRASGLAMVLLMDMDQPFLFIS